MPKFTANLGFLFKELSFAQRFEAAARSGFTAVEAGNPYELGADTVADLLQTNDLSMELINSPAGPASAGGRGLACILGHEAEFRESIKTALLFAEARRLNLAAQVTNTCPELAPPGKHLLVSGGAPADCSKPLDVEREIEFNIQDLRDNFPPFDGHAEVLVASCFHGNWPVYRAWPGFDMTIKTSVENLYNVGDAVKPSGWSGLPACTMSARQVVEDISARIKPTAA